MCFVRPSVRRRTDKSWVYHTWFESPCLGDHSEKFRVKSGIQFRALPRALKVAPRSRCCHCMQCKSTKSIMTGVAWWKKGFFYGLFKNVIFFKKLQGESGKQAPNISRPKSQKLKKMLKRAGVTTLNTPGGGEKFYCLHRTF